MTKDVSLFLLFALATSAPSLAQVSSPYQVIPRQSAPGIRITDIVVVADVPVGVGNLYERDAPVYPSVARVFVLTDRFRFQSGIGFLRAATPLENGFTAGGSAGYGLRPSRQLGQLDIEMRIGMSYTELDHPVHQNFTQVDVPLGIGASYFGPLPFGVSGAAWASGRGHMRRSDALNGFRGVKETTLGAGVSGGIVIERLPSFASESSYGFGLGVMASGEFLWLPSDAYPTGSDTEWLFNVGVFVRLSIIRQIVQ